MNIVLCIVSILFGGLSLFAAVSQMRTEKKPMPALVMLLGSVALISAAGCNLEKLPFDFVLALLGCAAICAAAIYNGLKGKNFHIQHHIIRIALSILLTVGFILL